MPGAGPGVGEPRPRPDAPPRTNLCAPGAPARPAGPAPSAPTCSARPPHLLGPLHPALLASPPACAHVLANAKPTCAACAKLLHKPARAARGPQGAGTANCWGRRTEWGVDILFTGSESLHRG